MLDNKIIEKIINGPMMLFLGQDYLTHENGQNAFLTALSKKYGDVIPPLEMSNCNDLLKLRITESRNSVSSWTALLSKNITIPSKLNRLVDIAWASVYTSAIDSVIDHTLKTSWRKIQPVYDENYKIANPRNKFDLHVTYLFGALTRQDPLQAAPLTLMEKVKRQFTTNALLQRIPEVVTPKGLIIFEGYNHNHDWITIEQLYSLISQLGDQQAIFCSAAIDFLQNPLVQDLIETSKILVFQESFSSLISTLEAEGKVRISIPEYEDHFGKWLTIGEETYKIPHDLVNRLAKTATIIDNSLFDVPPPKNLDEKYEEFKKFLGSTKIAPIWNGFPLGFAFKREYYRNLRTHVSERLTTNMKKEIPIVLHGQSSSGKTVSLGNLIFEIKREFKIPILFIEKRFQKVDEDDIDLFCQWAESRNTKQTLIVWDGMVEVDSYYNLLRRLNSRGRKVILVATTYFLPKGIKNENYIESPIELSDNEKVGFVEYIKSVDQKLLSILDVDSNMLSMLYRHLPDTRSKISTGLKSEFDHFKDLMNARIEKSFEPTPMYELLLESGLINRTEVVDHQEKEHQLEETSISDSIIYSIMVPGQFGIDVPFELLLRTIGTTAMNSKWFKLLNKVNIITWDEDNVGNIILGPRTSIEARILSQYLGAKSSEIKYIESLLSSVKSDTFSDSNFSSNHEIQFAVALLDKIGPNSNTDIYSNYFYELTNVLKSLRENNQAYHPRLMLKEASILREIVKRNKNTGLETNYQLLDRAEFIVREALDILNDKTESAIKNYLKVELASILGSKTAVFIEALQYSEAINAYYAVIETNNIVFTTTPSNYGALDVRAWSTEWLLKSAVRSDVKAEAILNMMDLFNVAETEGVSPQHLEEYLKRKLVFNNLIGNQPEYESNFKKLIEQNSAAGFYFEANQLLRREKEDLELNPTDLAIKYSISYKYLDTHFTYIKNDSRSLYLLFKSWWIMKNQAAFFEKEKATIPFTITEWEYCLYIIQLMTSDQKLADNPTINYIKAIAQFHLNDLTASKKTFEHLADLGDYSSYGGRRVNKSYLASNENGSPNLYSGEVRKSVSINEGKKIGDIYVHDLDIYIPFLLKDFHQSSFQKGDIISEFQIGFNFRGLLAVSPKYM